MTNSTRQRIRATTLIHGAGLDQTCPFRARAIEKLAARVGGGRGCAAEGFGAAAGCKLARGVNMGGIVLERRDGFGRIRGASRLSVASSQWSVVSGRSVERGANENCKLRIAKCKLKNGEGGRKRRQGNFVPVLPDFWKMERKSERGGGRGVTEVVGGQGFAELGLRRFSVSFVPGASSLTVRVDVRAAKFSGGGCAKVAKLSKAIV